LYVRFGLFLLLEKQNEKVGSSEARNDRHGSPATAWRYRNPQFIPVPKAGC
jgi:hypothetical protein